MEREYVKIVVLSLFVSIFSGCNQLNRTNVDPETSSITEEIQQANIEEQERKAEEQKKKQYKEDIGRYVFVEYQSGLTWRIYNRTEYTVEKVEITAWDYDFDLHEYVGKKEVFTFIPAGSYRTFESYSSLDPQITYIKCTALGMY